MSQSSQTKTDDQVQVDSQPLASQGFDGGSQEYYEMSKQGRKRQNDPDSIIESDPKKAREYIFFFIST